MKPLHSLFKRVGMFFFIWAAFYVQLFVGVASLIDPNVNGISNEMIHNGIHSDKGIAICTAKFAIDDSLALIDQFRTIYSSNLPIAIAHCSELEQSELRRFSHIPNLIAIDICRSNDQSIIPLEGSDLEKRLRSWYCKAAALIYSPFHEVMVVDVDTVWFKSPDRLFQYPEYQKTGTLFFRDRFYHSKMGSHKQSISFHDKAMQLIQAYYNQSANNKRPIDYFQKTIWTSSYAQSQLLLNNINYFWRNLSFPEKDPELDNYQDSSVILVNRMKHMKLLQIIGQLIPHFNVGWGDKELYWIASIIGNISYSFEPFLAGNYGPCGMLLHFDPNDQYLMNASYAKPLYSNAEWFLEKFRDVGGDLETSHSRPNLALPDTELFHIGDKGCGCVFMGCQSIDSPVMNQLLLRAQWERKSRAFDHNTSTENWPKLTITRHVTHHHHHRTNQMNNNVTVLRNFTVINTFNPRGNITTSHFLPLDPKKMENIQTILRQRCISISIYSLYDMKELMKGFIKKNECHRFGCAYIPYPEELLLSQQYLIQQMNPHYNATASSSSHGIDEGDNEGSTSGGSSSSICVPVSFEGPGAMKRLRLLTLYLLLPIPIQLEDGMIVKTKNSKQVYLYSNETFHGFPNGETFLKMGFSFDKITTISSGMLKRIPISSTLLPSL